MGEGCGPPCADTIEAIRTPAKLKRILLDPVYTGDDAALLSVIRQIRAGAPAALATRSAASNDLFSKGAEVQLVACKEFSVIASATAEGVRTIDTLDRMAVEMVSFPRGKADRDETAVARRSRAAAHENEIDRQGKEITPCLNRLYVRPSPPAR